MTIYEDTQKGTYILILEKNENLMTSLDSFFSKYPQISSLWINGIGGANKVEISFFDPKNQEYTNKTFEEDIEILSLQGNLSFKDGNPHWHIHGVFSNKKYEVFGGHVQDISIGLTGEIFLTPFSQKLSRSLDKKTGVQTIQKSHYDGHALQ